MNRYIPVYTCIYQYIPGGQDSSLFPDAKLFQMGHGCLITSDSMVPLAEAAKSRKCQLSLMHLTFPPKAVHIKILYNPGPATSFCDAFYVFNLGIKEASASV